MKLQFRGQPYHPEISAEKSNSKMIEGQYHGIKTFIPLPVQSSLSPFANLMIYRGIKLVP